MIKKVHYLLAYSPYLYLIAFYSFVARAIIRLGYIPSYNQPDPIVLHFDIHTAIIDNTFTISFFGVVLFILVTLFLILKSQKIDKKNITLMVVGVLIMLYNIFLDPFMEWQAD